MIVNSYLLVSCKLFNSRRRETTPSDVVDVIKTTTFLGRTCAVTLTLLPVVVIIIIIIIISLFTLGFQSSLCSSYLRAFTHPTMRVYTQRPDHNTGNYMPYSLLIVSGFFNVPQSYLQTRVVRRGLRFIVLIRDKVAVA